MSSVVLGREAPVGPATVREKTWRAGSCARRACLTPETKV
jgi:hypothetical protein